MKKIILLITICLLFSGNAYADNLPEKLFGIKLYDNIENYIDKNVGKKDKQRKGIINFSPEDRNQFKGLVANENLERYYVRTNSEYKILTISGFGRMETTPRDEFKDNCKETADNLKNLLSNYYDINPRKFKTKYYKNDYGYLVLNRAYETIYRKKGNEYNLQILCTYSNREKKIYQNLFVTLMDQKYFEENTLKLWKKMDPFDDKMITTNLEGF
jgi:hypothetical protein